MKFYHCIDTHSLVTIPHTFVATEDKHLRFINHALNYQVPTMKNLHAAVKLTCFHADFLYINDRAQAVYTFNSLTVEYEHFMAGTCRIYTLYN